MAKVKKVGQGVLAVASFIMTPQGARDVGVVVAAVGTVIQAVRLAGWW